jgi:hypothetical protein
MTPPCVLTFVYILQNLGWLYVFNRSRVGAGAASQFLPGAMWPHKNDAAPQLLYSMLMRNKK